MIELLHFKLSGNCHKVRLLLSLLGLAYRSVELDPAAGEHKSASFLALNPFGQVPLLIDGDTVVRDSHAILAYLGLRYGQGRWLPADPASQAMVHCWLFSAATEVARGPAALRLHHRRALALDVGAAQRISATLFGAMEARLCCHDWIAAGHITIADVALYPYLALAHEGELTLSSHPAIARWLRRIESAPGYAAMPGILPA